MVAAVVIQSADAARAIVAGAMTTVVSPVDQALYKLYSAGLALEPKHRCFGDAHNLLLRL